MKPYHMQVSELKVCHSAAGYYIGKLYWDGDWGCWAPWTRDSEEHWPTADEAQRALDTKTFTQRKGF